ncbi:transmembrane protein 106A isoform X2 [Aquila chrysaetos chrysaetos]|uniref:transmembrane protein 106A isoform X2 n=1 Tax=Aquila chrysaetos chrysaetos TaxID=223781 RepID=UPI001B7D305F|nr:transmembrane protein 106A isoform X2 [Aquila chrysaetos chrysaetos]
MGGKLSPFWKTPDQKEREGKLILPRQLDAEGEIANYASINDSATSCAPCAGIARRSCVNCPTCQGTGRIPREQEKQLVALIPYGDQRLKPRRTKLYVCVAVTICLLTTSLSIFFLFPRSVTVLPAGLNASSVGFNATTTSICLNMTIYYTVASRILDDNTYNICTWTKVKVHNVLLHIQGTLTCTYLCHSEQLAFEDYQYVDCRGNATLPHPLYHRVP